MYWQKYLAPILNNFTYCFIRSNNTKIRAKCESNHCHYQYYP
ncbi:hypothetical protein GLP23_03075 [Photobacterium carnosum]|nr:hypothetical protein [Photobacterium carnosum]